MSEDQKVERGDYIGFSPQGQYSEGTVIDIKPDKKMIQVLLDCDDCGNACCEGQVLFVGERVGIPVEEIIYTADVNPYRERLN